MSYFEEVLLRRNSGLRILVWSLVIGVAGVLPLLLYMALGLADGNPIGLGLLAVAVVPVGAMGMVVGLIVMLVQKFARPGE